ncbi:MAG: YhfC family glutamic-type intramembrane protease [Vagococcus sp.]|uniref:YhfC family glutamic-type intramembrane protease n=1 Tax=Vagococcus sp. TaxID=1933889 RepID=UPI002FCB7129
MTSLAIIFTISITFIFPLISFIYSYKQHRLKVFLLGGCAFIISQVILRLPLLSYLATHSVTYHQFQFDHIVLFSLFIGLSAGIFEEMTRFLFMTYLLKQQRSFKDGLFFGFGHGGVEALILVGIPLLVTLTSHNGAQLLGPTLFVSGIERFFSILLHVGLSIVVMWGVKENKKGYLLLAILIHTLTDSLIPILTQFTSQPVVFLEGVLIIVSLSLFMFCLHLRKRWHINEKNS